MATRGGLRTWLRRRLQETTPAQWTDSTLNDYINTGYHFVQEEIEVLEPDAFAHYIDKSDIVASQTFYPLPVNAKAPRRLRLKTASGGSYSDIEQVEWMQTVPKPTEAQQIEPTRAQTVWSLQGRYIRLEPTPTANVTDGLELTYQPVLVLSADSDVPEMTVNHHPSIVFYAQVLALGDTANVTDRAAALEDINQFIARLPRHWQRTLAKQWGNRISVAPHVKYGPSSASGGLPNDWDSRS